MKTKLILAILFLFSIKATIAYAQPIYKLLPGEEFVFGKIGTFENGDHKYTLAIVRKRNENKPFYKMGYIPYRDRILQNSENLKLYNTPEEHHKYDFWLIFNGKKFGPYDEIYDMNFKEPNVDKWVSRDGKSISFCGKKGDKFWGVVHNKEQNFFYTPSTSLTIDPNYTSDVYGLWFSKGNIKLYGNGKLIKGDFTEFKDIEHGVNGDLLYKAKEKNKTTWGLYVNHRRVTGGDENVHEAGFIPGTSTLYYKVNITNGKYRVVVGEHRYEFKHSIRPVDFYFANNYVVFNVFNSETNKSTLFEYNVKTRKMNKHGEYKISDMDISRNKLAYSLKAMTKENGKFVYNYTFMLEGGKVIDTYKAKAGDRAFMRISPKGDYFIIKEENKTYKITKNGHPYPFKGEISQWESDAFSSLNDNLIVMSEVKSDIKNSQNSDVRLDVGDKYYAFKGMYQDGSLVVAENADMVYSVHSGTGTSNNHKMLFKNGSKLLNGTWKYFDRTVTNSKGNHFAVMACNYMQNWPANNKLGYYTTNVCMSQNWKMIVDGKVLDDKYGAPAYLKSLDKLVSLKQEGNSIIMVDLVSGQNISGWVTNTDFVKIKSKWKNTLLNIEHGITCGNIDEGWHSAHWVLEPVEGSNNVRIRNRWKNTYLNIENGEAVQCTEIQPGWLSAMWVVERINGNKEVRLKNCWKGTYLNLEHGSLRCTDIQQGWLSAVWGIIE